MEEKNLGVCVWPGSDGGSVHERRPWGVMIYRIFFLRVVVLFSQGGLRAGFRSNLDGSGAGAGQGRKGRRVRLVTLCIAWWARIYRPSRLCRLRCVERGARFNCGFVSAALRGWLGICFPGVLFSLLRATRRALWFVLLHLILWRPLVACPSGHARHGESVPFPPSNNLRPTTG